VTITSGDKVLLDLAPIVVDLKQQLVKAGLSIAGNIPAVGVTLEIAELKGVNHARRMIRLLDTLADWLPWLGLALIASGLWAGRQRRRALIRAALGVVLGMLVVEVGLLFGREYFLDQIPADQLPRDTAASVFETVVRYLRLSLRLTLLVALLVAIGAWLSGPSPAATTVRHWGVTGPRALGASLDTGPVGAFAVRYATPLRVGIVAAMFVILALTTAPSLGTIITLAVVCVLLLLAVEVLRAGARHVNRAGVPADAGRGGPTTPSS
jgi:LPXTG-motif cell wall-anchored protein